MNDTTKMWVPDLGSRVALLRSEINNGESDQLELPIAGTPVDCSVGMDSGGSLWVRIVCDGRSVSVDDRSAHVGFVVKPHSYRIVVASTAAESAAVHFLDEVVQLLRSGHAPGDAGRAALQNWRELLAHPAGAPLSESALVGLYGELVVLLMILRNGGQLDQWTGWNRDHCDFRLPGLVIEVKSTTSANYRRVTIHGLGQLADPEDGSDLILVLRRLESSPDGRSVPDLTEEIIRLGASRSVLLDRLSQIRYSEQHRTHYEQVKFVSQEVALRRIDDAHPRLVSSMLAGVDLSCIDRIEYELNLNGQAEADLQSDLDSLIAEKLGAS